jgi:DNA modification methylase
MSEPKNRTPRRRNAQTSRRGPVLSWPARVFDPAAPFGPDPGPVPRAMAVEACAGDNGSGRLVLADALDLARMLEGEGHKGQVELVYVDPPYGSQADYELEARLDGSADGRVRRAPAYEDTWADKDGGASAYLDMLAPRLAALSQLLSPRGTIWVHVDWRASYLVRVLLDEIMGREAFINEIVWRRAPNLGRQAKSAQFGRTLDTLVVYGGPKARLAPPMRKEPIEPRAIRYDEQGRPFTSAPRGDYTDLSIEKLDLEGRVHRTASGKVYIKYFLVPDETGTLCRERPIDALWTDIPPLRHAKASERTGFPTQKPVALLERIIECATKPGDLVVDAFSGSGTTVCAAARLQRVGIGGDKSMAALSVARTRLIAQGSAVRFDALGPLPARAPVSVRHKVHGRTRTVELVTPKEPRAWTVLRVQNGVPTAVFHSQRGAGKEPSPIQTSCDLQQEGPLLVRVYLDDGAVGETSVDRSSAGTGTGRLAFDKPPLDTPEGGLS